MVCNISTCRALITIGTNGNFITGTLHHYLDKEDPSVIEKKIHPIIFCSENKASHHYFPHSSIFRHRINLKKVPARFVVPMYFVKKEWNIIYCWPHLLTEKTKAPISKYYYQRSRLIRALQTWFHWRIWIQKWKYEKNFDVCSRLHRKLYLFYSNGTI